MSADTVVRMPIVEGLRRSLEMNKKLDILNRLTPDQIRALSPEQLAMAGDVIYSMQQEVLSILSPEQLSALIVPSDEAEAKKTSKSSKKKPETRGRKSVLSKREAEWIISHCNIDISNMTPVEISTKIASLRNRPSREGNRLKKSLGTPLSESDSKNSNLTSCRYGVYLVFDKSDTSEILGIHVSIAKRSNFSFPYDMEVPGSKKEALREANNLLKEINSEFRSLDSMLIEFEQYIQLAAELLKKAHISKSDLRPHCSRVGFAVALAWIRDSPPVSQKPIYEATVKSLSNRRIPTEERDFNYGAYIFKAIESFARSIQTGKYITESYLRLKSKPLRRGIEELHTLFKHHNNSFGNFIEVFDVELERVARKYADDLRDEESYPPFPLSDIEKLLEAAANTSMKLYCRIIVQLSTCLRIDEMDKFHGDGWLLNDGTLRYSTKNPRTDSYLSTKTIAKLPRNQLVNPGTDLVTRIILKNQKKILNFIPKTSTKFAFWRSDSPVRQKLKQNGPERSLRATAATMLVFSAESKICSGNITYRDVQNRMAHKTASMITEVYAKNRPADSAGKSVDEYFQIQDIAFKISGKVVSLAESENAWGLWLFLDFYRRFKPRYAEKLNSWIKAEILEIDTYKPETVFLDLD